MRTQADIQRAMHDYLPLYYTDVTPANNVIDREAEEIAALNIAINDVLAQFFIVTATWGLARWEQIFGIPTDEAKPIEQRRSVIKSKLRGVGTVTPALIEQVAEAYDNGDVTVTEDNASYNVTITFVSTLGIPPNLGDIKAAIRDILPAHLTVNFVFRYYLYANLIAIGKKYAEIAAITYDDLYNGRGV
ncbi:YmfQ family protein [Cohnella mopanensis]|uniref:YmfQ family protein n=1 Tax=Cohnella mopanensis TaxID=2911966 RepID=UPI001EF8633B|nr:YmfQ family protein [Cohnella mopanensis]